MKLNRLVIRDHSNLVDRS